MYAQLVLRHSRGCLKILSHPGHDYLRRVYSRAVWICRAWCLKTFPPEDFFNSENGSCMRRETFLDNSQKKQLILKPASQNWIIFHPNHFFISSKAFSAPVIFLLIIASYSFHWNIKSCTSVETAQPNLEEGGTQKYLKCSMRKV